MRASELVASGEEPPAGPASPLDEAGHASQSSGLGELPLSTLGPPVSALLDPVAENDDEEYEPSDTEGPAESGGASGDALALETEEPECPESSAEAQAVDRANRRWVAAASTLQLQACPVLEVPFIRMLPNKSQPTVVQALAAMLSQIQYEGFMVRRVHSDRGREFNNSGVHRTCTQRNMFQTFTQGDDPKQNGRVESFHARLKSKTRTLLKGADVQLTDWPYAMRTAHASLLAQALRRFGREVLDPLPFGTQVRVRTRSWERDLWSARVQDATVLAPSIETCKGHVVRTAAGTLMHTTAIFKGVVRSPPPPVGVSSVPLPAQTRQAPAPLSAPAGPEVHVRFPSEPVPTHRVVGKQSLSQLKAVKLRFSGPTDTQALSTAAAALLSCRPVPFRTAAALIVSAPVLRELAQALPARLAAGKSSSYLLLGWYKHGGITGLSSLTTVLPGVVQLLNTLLHQAHPHGTWTTLGLFFSAVAGPHVDRRNAKNTYNYVLPLALPQTEQYMWVQRAVQEPLESMAWLGEDGSVYPGFRLPLRVGQPACVSPHFLHALPAPLPQEATSDHVLLVGFSVPWIHRATPEQYHQLQAHGFRLECSRGGVSQVGSNDVQVVSGDVHLSQVKEKSLEVAMPKEFLDTAPGLLELCLTEEGHRHLHDNDEMSQEMSGTTLQQDLQEDTAATGSVTGRGAYARRLETRVFEPANWERVKKYLKELGLEHLIGAIDDLGIDDLQDFEFLYREDLMEAGATKEEAEAILGCTGAVTEGRPEPPPLARSGLHRPSRPAAQGFQGPAVAARIVRTDDRAARVLNAVGVPGRGAAGLGATQGAAGSGAGQGVSCSGIAQGAADLGTRSGVHVVDTTLDSPGEVVPKLRTVRSHVVFQHDAQGEAPAGEVLADPLGRNVPGGKAGALAALGIPLGEAGLYATLHVQGQGTARVSHTPQGISCEGESKGISHREVPEPIRFSPHPADACNGAPEPIRFSPHPADACNGAPEPIRFSPHPADACNGAPEPLRFSPHPADAGDKASGPLRFSSGSTGSCTMHEGSPDKDASICALPLAVLVCRALKKKDDRGRAIEVDMVVEELPLSVEPGGVRKEEARLDQVVVELRALCDSMRRIVLDVADDGGDCSLEAQELSRLIELEQDLTQELETQCFESHVFEHQAQNSEPEPRLCHLQADVGGGCHAEIEGQAGAPLQTKIISVEEVLRDIEGWWNPMLAEYQALVQEKQVVVPVTAQELARREAAGEGVQVIPAKLIFTLKAFTARRKVRCVGCGNYLGADTYTANQLYAGGLDVVSLRCCLVFMVHRQWSAGVVDIKTAFLNAELEKEDLGTKRVVIRTPSLWRRLGICTEMFWDVQRALYGLQISPAAWSRCRDRTLPRLRLATSSGLVRLIQFKSDSNIWAIVPADAGEPVDPSQRLGLLLVYVDDMMVLSTPQIIGEVIAELGKQWELSRPELLDEGNVHYRGVEVRRGEGGIWVHQESYTREILSRYPDKGGADVPALKLPEVVQLERQDPQIVRRAQQIAGELLWLSGLTRPEIQFAVRTISRTISVNAEEAVTMGEQVIKYLRRYPARGLWYSAAAMEWGDEGDLSVPMGRNSLVGFCDASFAPFSSRSLQATLAFYSGALISWSSTRQGLTTLSTAESELVGITSLFTELQALEPLVREIHGAPVAKQMHSDSQAAIAICTTASTNWRTRHLRIRASHVREVLESGQYSLHHISGDSMKADIGTKPLPVARFQQLTSSLGMADLTKDAAAGEGHRSGLDEKVKALILSLVVASLLQPASAHRVLENTSAARDLGHTDWQFIVGLIVVTVCCWEVAKVVGSKILRCGWSTVRKCVRCFFGKQPAMEELTALEGPGAPSAGVGANTVTLTRHADDVLLVGPREAVLRELRSQEDVSEHRGRRRQVSSVATFRFNSVDFSDWPSRLHLNLAPVGQDRWEFRDGQRSVLRWHLSSRVRLFTPEGTRPPVDMTAFTGRRRTWIINSAEEGRPQRVLHVDDWLRGTDVRAYVHFPWIGCTELEIQL